MCFSAPASFLASSALAAAGASSLKKAKKEARLFASIPLLFAVQQFFEGLQWTTEHPSTASLVYGYAFLFFAFLVWPTYMPFAVYRLEKNRRHKRLLAWFIAAGALVTVVLFAILITQPLTVLLLPYGVFYQIYVPFDSLGILAYAAVVCGSCLASTQAYLRWFGVALAASAMAAWFIYAQTFVSVWCFFAAALSVLVFVYFLKQRSRFFH